MKKSLASVNEKKRAHVIELSLKMSSRGDEMNAGSNFKYLRLLVKNQNLSCS